MSRRLKAMSISRLKAIYAQALNERQALACRYFYEVHNRLIQAYANRHNIPMLNACIAFGRLSARTSVRLNIKAFIALLNNQPKPAGILSANWHSAKQALCLSEAEALEYLYNQPLSKVRAFSRNLLLDTSVITLDSIMLRILKDLYPIPSHNHLFRHYAYWHSLIYADIQALEPAMPAFQVQAILWQYARQALEPIPNNARLI
jgi:hypothetical protein